MFLVIFKRKGLEACKLLWVTLGIQRPYKTPEHVTAKKDKKHYYYIRYDDFFSKGKSHPRKDQIKG